MLASTYVTVADNGGGLCSSVVCPRYWECWHDIAFKQRPLRHTSLNATLATISVNRMGPAAALWWQTKWYRVQLCNSNFTTFSHACSDSISQHHWMEVHNCWATWTLPWLVNVLCTINLQTTVTVISTADLPYDNETHDNGQKDCSHYLFVCDSESITDDCPSEVRCYCVSALCTLFLMHKNTWYLQTC